MILARISRAIREQNWFAVVLEFVIVIAGVVIGFQVTAWNAERQNQARVERALVSLQIEAEQNVVALRQRITRNEARVAEQAIMVNVAARGEVDANDADAFERAIAQLMYFSQIPVQRSTYQALEQSGDLALITDPELIIELSRYQTQLDWVEAQHASFRNGLSTFTDVLNEFVFHEATDNPLRTRARVDLVRLAEEPRRSSALIQMARMHAIFNGYIETLETQTLAVCETLAAETGTGCNTGETP